MTEMISYLHRDCPLCGSKTNNAEVSSGKRGEELPFGKLQPYWSGLFKEKVFFTYARCSDCGLLYCPTYFEPEQLSQLYANMAPNMELVPSASLIATQLGYWKSVANAVVADGDYLEIGPDIGYIVGHAAASGQFRHFWLCEPNIAVHDTLARAAGGKPHTISGEMEDLSAIPDRSVSLAVMIHVLDHLLDPLATLRSIQAKLKPGGLLLIVTHNEKSLLRRAMSTRWPPFCLQHPEIYNPDSISRLVKEAGFSKVNVARSANHFPLDFMVRQAAYGIGLSLAKLPLPKVSLGLKLGNILTIATQ